MAYIRPIVLVYQEYASLGTSTSQSNFNACIVGPCYHIVDETDADEISYIGEITSAGLTETQFPSLKPGLSLESDSVKVVIKSPKALLNTTSYDVTSILLNRLTFTTLPSEVQVGDYLDLYDDTTLSVSNLRVVSIDVDNKNIFVNKNAPTNITTPKIKIKRGVSDIVLDSTSSSLTINSISKTLLISPLTVSINSTSKSIVEGSVFVYYKALRTDLTQVNNIDSIEDVSALLGKITPENPLAFGASVALANTVGGVKVVGIPTNDLAGYTAAKDVIESASDIYAIIPLTQDVAVLSMFKFHVEEFSKPEIGKWRIAIGNTQLQTTKTLFNGVGKVLNDFNSSLKVVEIENVNLINLGVTPGDKVYVNNVSYTIDSVLNETALVTTTVMSGVVSGNTYTVKIVKNLTKSQQAENIAEVSKSFNSRRFIHVWPDICVINGKEVKGYYLACAVGGAVAGLPQHQGLTNISLAGVTAIKNSNDYFNNSQIDIISSGGTMVFIQESPTAAPKILHQLTTDMSSVEFRELNFVKNFDAISYSCKRVLDNFIGQYNINPNTLNYLETAVRSVLQSYKLSSYPKIGSPIIDFEIVSISQSSAIKDRVEIQVNLMLPYALNTIGLHLVSQ